MTFPACAFHQLFVRSWDLAHHGLHCSHVCVCSHHSSLQHLPFRCLPLLSSRAHMDEPQCMRLPLGTTEWNHSYYTGNSLSALHSLQQVQAGASSPSPVQMSASTRQSQDAAPSSSVPCPQSTLSATHPQVRTGLTRTITNDLLSATLAEAATQLSFAEFLERCISVSAPPPPPLSIPTPPLDAATQTIFHTSLLLGTLPRNSRSGSSWLHLLLLTFYALRLLDQSPRYFLMRLCRRLYTASQLMMPPHNNRSRSSLSGVSSPVSLQIVKARHRYIVMPTAPHLHNPLTLLPFAAPAAPAMLAMVMSTLRPHTSY